MKRGSIFAEIFDTLRGWAGAQLKITGILMLLYCAGYALVGLPWWFALGVVSGVLNLFPIFGSLVALAIAMGAVLFTDGTWQQYASVLAVFVMVQGLEGFVITPMLLGRRLRMSPLLVFGAVLAGGMLFGPIGLLFAVPALAVALVIWRRRAA